VVFRSIPPALLVGLSCLCLQAQVTVSGRVVDETGAGVEGARIEVRAKESTTPIAASSDLAGNFKLTLPVAGPYSLLAERQGFFVFRAQDQHFDPPASQLIVTLNHQREFTEKVDVVASPPVIDSQQPADRKAIDTAEVISVPFAGSQDYRNAIRLLDGAVQDSAGQYHLDGGAANQTSYSLDGFNVANPVTGLLDARVNVESVQFLNVESSRMSAETGRGSAGDITVETKMGDDRLRFGGTNFIPGVSSVGGFHLNHWTPRLELSGPIKKGRAWFHDGADLYYSNDTIHGLPRGQNRTSGTTMSNLSRFQVDLTPSNVFTGGILFNLTDASRYGLSNLNPAESTINNRQMLLMSTLRDQQYFAGGALLEAGFADTRGFLHSTPQGDELFQITPTGNRGNYFENLNRHFYRQQAVSNLFLPTVHLGGTHQVKFGIDFERESFHQQTDRHDYELLDAAGNATRYVTFEGNPFQARKNSEAAQYVQDHWTIREGLALEAGVRAEWNQIVRDYEIAPRFSVAWAPKALSQTKFSAGWGVYYDALSLQTVSQPAQTSLATFYLPDGTVVGPVATTFQVQDRLLKAPFYRTASFSTERKMPGELYLRATFTHRTGSHGLVFQPLNPAAAVMTPAMFYQDANYLLTDTRSDRYDGFDISVRRTFAKQFEWFIGYTRSRARTNESVVYSLENPIFALQAPGPLPWDAPNRLHLWGWAPMPHRRLPEHLQFLTRNTTMSLLAEYRTGFPFGVVDQNGFQVGQPFSMRYPLYLTINFALERTFPAIHYFWALRVGVDNLTDHRNPTSVENVIGTPEYLTFYRGPTRALDVRLRFLGKK
jgi:hypothetical protein